MNDADRQRLIGHISDFLHRYGQQLGDIASATSHVFEAFCFVIIVRYYEETGYRLRPKNLLEGRFRFRYSTAGYPWNFSYFAILPPESKDEEEAALFEVRHNQKVAGAWVDADYQEEDKALFAVDVAVIEAGSLPDLPQGHKRTDEPFWVENSDLITFAEAKNLTAYPMLLAQFLGTVHEIKPDFLRIHSQDIPQRFWQQNHPSPALMTANHVTAGTQRVLRSFEERGFVVKVIDEMTNLPEEMLISKLKGENNQGATESDEQVPF
jgi:hypothetical protein